MELSERGVFDAQQTMAYFWGKSAGNRKVNKKVLDVFGEMLARCWRKKVTALKQWI